MQAKTTTRPEPALHLLVGRWIASCPDCGHELAASSDQEVAERWAAEVACPVCQGVPR